MTFVAFLSALSEVSPALTREIHDTSRPNPISPLERTDGTQGGTTRVIIKPHQEKLGFKGSFAYNLCSLPKEARRQFLLLVRFAELVGVKRLTSQGFGQVQTSWR